MSLQVAVHLPQAQSVGLAKAAQVCPGRREAWDCAAFGGDGPVAAGLFQVRPFMPHHVEEQHGPISAPEQAGGTVALAEWVRARLAAPRSACAVLASGWALLSAPTAGRVSFPVGKRARRPPAARPALVPAVLGDPDALRGLTAQRLLLRFPLGVLRASGRGLSFTLSLACSQLLKIITFLYTFPYVTISKGGKGHSYIHVY